MIITPPQPKGFIELPADWERIAREAAEKIPLKDATRELMHKLTADLDAALLAAVERYLGHPLTDPEIVLGRLTNVTIEGEEGETYCMDGVPLLWAGPPVIERVGDTLKGDRKFLLLEQDADEQQDPKGLTTSSNL